MATNHDNFGFISGRLVKDPLIRDNANGSKTVLITVAAKNNYKDSNGDYTTEFVQLKGFVREGAELGAYGFMKKGAPWSFMYSVKTNNYTDKDGVAHYGQELRVESAQVKETKNQAEAREAKAQAAAAVETEAAAE